MKYIINLNCGICGTKTGKHTLDSKFGWTGKESPESLGYVDIRCDACRSEHGEFKDMVEEYQATVNPDPMEAENFVKENRTRTEFDAQIAPLVESSAQLQKNN